MENRIKEMRVYKAKSKLSQPIADATHSITDIAFFVVELELNSGVIGQGYLLSFHYSPKAILGALQDLQDFVVGYEVNEMVKLKQDVEIETEYFGHNGILKWAYATVNVAMWDAWGKVLNKPIHEILGVSRREVPVYGSGGWLSYTDEELIEEVTNYKNRGFQAVKIKVGSKKEGRDLERLTKVREAVGNEIKIMMDANQGMDLPSAIKLSREASKINIHWFEEPVDHKNFAGYELLRAKTDISLAMGEREYDVEPLKELIRRNALDLWQPDIIRIGGVEAWRDSAALANAYNIPVLPHYYKDYDVPLLCTVENGYGAESFDWIDAIIDEPMEIVDGIAKPREKPGWGFVFEKEFLEEVK